MTRDWQRDMKVGIDVIDDDHRQLFAIVKDFEHAAITAKGAVDMPRLGEILHKLKAYVAEHFAREEQMQQEARYEGYEDNKRQHEELTRTLDRFIARFDSGEMGEGKVATDAMKDFLSVWLGGHILKTDRKMRGRILPWSG